MKKLVKILLNKYLITFLVFLLIVLFYDDNNVRVLMGLRKEVHVLEEERDGLKREMYYDSVRLAEMKSSRDELERYGREVYRMKTPQEDVYIVIDDEEEK